MLTLFTLGIIIYREFKKCNVSEKGFGNSYIICRFINVLIEGFQVFVLDEADVMIDTQGHKDQTIRIHRTLDKEKCQFLFFSATYDDEVMKFAEKIIPHPNTIKLKREEETLSNIKQYQVRFKVINRKFSFFFLKKSFE